MSNWKEFWYNDWFSVKARNHDEAKSAADKRLKYEFGSTENITETKFLGGAWKQFNFKGWFLLSARSPEEALKRAIDKISKMKSVLVADDEVDTVGFKDPEGSINDSFLTDQEVGLKTAHHFMMSTADHEMQLEVHATTAKEAWNSMREKFVYEHGHDVHVIMSQEVRLPQAISPKWRISDIERSVKTPTRLSHQVVVAIGMAGEAWWASYDNVLKVDENANLIASPDLPLSI